jgi:hypothetical protein
MSKRHTASFVALLVYMSVPFSNAAAADDTVKLVPTAIEFPRVVGPLSMVGETYVYPDPGSGAYQQFKGDGWLLFIYTYNANNKDLPDGADTGPACVQFERAKSGFLASDNYQNGVLKRESLVALTPPAPLPQVREAAIEADMNGKHALIYIWLTTVDKQLVKLQLMTRDSNRDRVPEVRRLILGALGKAISPHLAPADPDTKPPKNGININGLGAADDEMQFGFVYLGTLSAIIDKQPERGPVCGGEYEPRFEEEVGAYKMAIMVNDGSSVRSKALKSLIAAEKAGFLDEMIWTHLKRESWGTVPPEGLDLAAFEPWEKKNVKRFLSRQTERGDSLDALCWRALRILRSGGGRPNRRRRSSRRRQTHPHAQGCDCARYSSRDT